MTEEKKDKQPLVSIVIPTFNRSKELARAIKSVLNQTHQKFEILVVDDGSEEDLIIVCDSFNDHRIRFLRNETHTNANVARNRGIKEANGEYIAMLDSDDEYLPHHLSRRIEKIKEWNCDGIFGSAYIFDGEQNSLKLSRPLNPGENMINYLLSDGFAPTPSHFYKKAAAQDILWDETLYRHQDYDFSVRFADIYNFRSDYEPTTVINWSNKSNRKIKYNDCIKFYKMVENRISITNKIKYLQLMIQLVRDSKNSSVAKIFYKQQLTNHIKFLSITQYLGINDAISFQKRIFYRIKYIIIILFK